LFFLLSFFLCYFFFYPSAVWEPIQTKFTNLYACSCLMGYLHSPEFLSDPTQRTEWICAVRYEFVVRQQRKEQSYFLSHNTISWIV
jgi:hypothetical protein